MKWVLVKKSDGQRGAQGRSKMYEVTVQGSTVLLAWGKAEEPLRVTQVRFANDRSANAFAREKVIIKSQKGYKILVAV